MDLPVSLNANNVIATISVAHHHRGSLVKSLRAFGAIIALVLVPFTSAHAQHATDTARYVVLFSGRPAGEYREWW